MKAMLELDRSMEDEFVGRIKRERATRTLTLESARKARKLSAEQGRRKAASLEAPLQQLEQLMQRIGTLVRAASDPSFRAPRNPSPRRLALAPVCAEEPDHAHA
jgi:hypothetical protein